MKPTPVLLLILLIAAYSLEATAQEAPARKEALRDNPQQALIRHVIGKPGDIKLGGSWFEAGVLDARNNDTRPPQRLKTPDQARPTRAVRQAMLREKPYDWAERRIIGKPGDIKLGDHFFGDGALAVDDAVEAPEAADAVEARPEPEAPATYGLKGYPNPFNPTSTLTFELPTRSDVRLVVYDVLGRLVHVLIDGVYEAGRHQATFEGAHLPSGVYLVRLTTPEGNFTHMMTLAK